MDIAQLILDDHHEQRRLFATLDDVPRDDTERLAAVWDRLATFLEVHAEAEEQHFYPQLLDVGEGAGEKDSPEAETTDAIDDHNEIREHVAEARRRTVGSDEWWEAVTAARAANSDHMGEEERQALADFRRHADAATRHELGVAFAGFEAGHAEGVDSEEKDPDGYVEQMS